MSDHLKDLLGDEFLTVNEQGEVIQTTGVTLKENERIGIYFSAHWCPPCRGFTPNLAECYKKIKAKNKKFEIVFVSSDRDEESFKEYFKEMPWLALPFVDRERKSQLSEEYDITVIPTLVLLNSDGEVVTMEGRSKVTNDPDGDGFPW